MACILVVDDRPANRAFLLTLLGYQHHRLLEASDGAEALARVKSQRPDLVITDILMPTMDGYEFVRQLRADPAVAATAVIFCTAHYHKREAEALASSCGVDHILIKPCEPEDVLQVVEESLRAPRQHAPPLSPEDFDKEHLRVITDKLSRTADDLHISTRRLDALVDINLELASERDPRQLLKNVCPAARDLFGAKQALLAVWSKNEDDEIYSVTSGMDSATAERLSRPRLREGAVGRALAERKALRLANLRGDLQAAGLPPGHPPAHSLLVAPIVSLAQAYGWICLTDKVGAEEFSAEDERLLGILGAQVGRIYENGRLYGEIQEHTTRLQAEIDRSNRTQLALSDSETRFRQMAENIREVFWLTDPAKNEILYISPAYEDIWGRSCQSVYASPHDWIDAIHPEDRDRVMQAAHSKQATGEYVEEYRIVRPDGTIRWIRDRAFPVLRDNGEVYRIAGLAEDITRPRRAQEALRESERRYSDLLGNVQLASLMLDCEACITYCNEYLLRLTGWRYEEVIGRNWFELFMPPDARQTKEAFAALLRNEPEAWHHENEIVTRAGGRRLVRWNNSVLRSEAGDVIGTASIGEDITEQKRYQESLRQNEERTRLIVEASLDAVVIMDAAGRITDWNAQAEKTFGRSRGEAVGALLVETIVPVRYRGAHADGLRAFLATEEGPILNKRLELSALHRDGHEFPVELSISPLRLEGGWIFSSFIRDLTEGKRAEEALVLLQRKSELILESIGEGIHGIDLEGRIIFENPGAAKLLGYSIEELSGRLAHATMHYSRKDGSTYPLAECPIHATMHDGVMRRVADEVFWRKDGSSFPVEYTTAPIRNDRDNITGAVVAFRDIAERKNAENRIRRLNRMHAMLSGINTLIVRARDRDELFREACRIAVEAGGFTMAWIGVLDPGALDGKVVAWFGGEEGFIDIVRLTVREGTPCSERPACRALRESQPVICNDVASDLPAGLLRDGLLARGHLSTACFPVIVAGQPEGVFALLAAESNVFDEEEVRLLLELAGNLSFALDHQRVIGRSADLEQARNEANLANRAKSSFLAAMSHEIRTPMNGVIGMIDVLHQTSLMGDQVEMVELIRESGFSLLQIIDDILDFSKIEAGRLEIERTPMSVADVVEKSCGMLDQLAAKKGVALTVFVDPAIPASLLGDKLRLRQVLLNLVGNAIKFSSGRKQAGRVSVRVVPTECAAEQVQLEIHVIDNGIGMDAETQVRVFDAFTQADTSTTRRFGGTGLGLVISRHLVQLMGGHLTLQSSPEQGSTFSVSLPFARHPGETQVIDAASDVSGLCCLIVGGAGELTETIAAYLAHGGARVERAANLIEARTLTSGWPPGQWIWIFDAAGTALPMDELRALATSHPQQAIRFITLVRGSLGRLPSRQGDLAWLDGNALTRRRLFRTVAIAAGRVIEEDQVLLSGNRAAAFKALTREEALRSGRLILVAEDNETNQKVILRQLALLGLAADVADNGREALERWQSGDYALLLSDLHMPEMDGYELTAAIRSQEHESRRIPIVALTANALKGEADHCRSVGMDDYLSKPLQLADLKATLATWLPVPPAIAPSHDSAAPRAAAAVDVSVLEGLIGNDPALILEFLGDFRVSAAKIALELQAAGATQQAVRAGEQAHKLKSSARTVGALALGDLCARLEDAGKAGDAEALARLLPMFEQELSAVNAELDALQARGVRG